MNESKPPFCSATGCDMRIRRGKTYCGRHARTGKIAAYTLAGADIFAAAKVQQWSASRE
jgi:hypothetical protein